MREFFASDLTCSLDGHPALYSSSLQQATCGPERSLAKKPVTSVTAVTCDFKVFHTLTEGG